MKIFGFTPLRPLATIFLLSAFILGLWYFQIPPAAQKLNGVLPASAVAQSQQPPPASQTLIRAEPRNPASPEAISNRAAEKVKEYADVRRKLRSGEITTLPANLAPPAIPEPIEPLPTNP